jgi:arginine-tRNA-protein transferase
MIEEIKRRGLPYLYLGYLIRESRKMAYKAHYRPLEVFRDGRWQPLE